MMPETKSVAKLEDLSPGDAAIVEVGDREIALFNVDGQIYATDNRCLHQGGPLGDGILEGSVVSCPWHAWTFDVRTGECTFNSEAKLECIPVQVEGDDIQVLI